MLAPCKLSLDRVSHMWTPFVPCNVNRLKHEYSLTCLYLSQFSTLRKLAQFLVRFFVNDQTQHKQISFRSPTWDGQWIILTTPTKRMITILIKTHRAVSKGCRLFTILVYFLYICFHWSVADMARYMWEANSCATVTTIMAICLHCQRHNRPRLLSL